MTGKPRILIVEFNADGHFPNYLKLLVEGWRSTPDRGVLHLAVTNRLVRNHPGVFAGESAPGTSVEWSTIPAGDEEKLQRWRAADAAGLDFAGGTEAGGRQTSSHFAMSLAQRVSSDLGPAHLFFPTIDDLVLPLAAGQRLPVDFSGLMLRPVFNYADRWAPQARALGRANGLVERMFLDRFFQHPQFRTAFLIDPHVAGRLSGRVGPEIVYVADPVRLPASLPGPADLASIRRALGIPAGKAVLLMFGALGPRKGIAKTIEALRHLPEDLRARACLAIVGEGIEGFEATLAERLAGIDVATVRRNAYVDDAEMGLWLDAADLVLAPYQNHIGMSGLLVLAAAHRRPIVSQDYGLMGELTRSHGLGATCNSLDAEAIREVLAGFLATGTLPGHDPARADAFALAHAHEAFAGTIYSRLLPLT